MATGSTKPSTMRRRPLYLLFVATAVAIAAWSFRPRPLQVEVAKVERGPVVVVFTEEGRTRLRERFTVAAPVAGVLERIELEPGDPVVAGSRLAVIRAPRAALLDAAAREEARARLQAAADQSAAAAAALRAANARARDRDVALARAARLARSQLVPRGDVDALRAEADVARADVVAAAARLSAARAEERVARSVVAVQGGTGASSVRIAVEAPITGRVVRRAAESETMVAAGQPLLEVGDLRDLEIVVDALSSDAVRIGPGTPVEVENWGGDAVLPGRVLRIEPGAFVKISALGVEEQRVPVVLRLLRPAPPTLGDGFRVDARFIVWRGEVPSVPVAALFRDGERWAVYAVEGGRARLRDVRLGHIGETRAEVLAGLEVGSTVVLYPGDRLREDSRVSATGSRTR